MMTTRDSCRKIIVQLQDKRIIPPSNKNINLTPALLETILREYFRIVHEEVMVNGEKIAVRPYGNWERKFRKGRVKGRNPKTGEVLPIKPSYKVAFVAGKRFRVFIDDTPATN